jgi:hypothetical protein
MAASPNSKVWARAVACGARMRRPRVLVLEASDHFKIMEQVHRLLGERCDLTFGFPVRGEAYDWRDHFRSAPRGATVTFAGDRLFFLRAMTLAFHRDWIYIESGPDFARAWDALAFLVFCWLFRRKIIFTFRNLSPYLKSSPGLACRLRNMAIRRLKRLTFETATQRDVFLRTERIRTALVGVSYDRYVDEPIGPRATVLAAPSSEGFRVGLLGTVNPLRRDYGLVAKALSRLPRGCAEKISMVVLGGSLSHEAASHLQGLAEFVAIDSPGGFLTEEAFRLRGESCDVLLAPLTSSKAYGTLNGSGCFGDSVFLDRKLILPRFADPAEEFKEMCFYYSDAEELADLLARLADAPRTRLPPEFRRCFTPAAVLDRLERDLQLCRA